MDRELPPLLLVLLPLEPRPGRSLNPSPRPPICLAFPDWNLCNKNITVTCAKKLTVENYIKLCSRLIFKMFIEYM